MRNIPIPRYVDRPPQILFWTADEFVPVVSVVMLGMLSGLFAPSLVVAILLSLFLRKSRGERLDGYSMHFMWWAGLLPVRCRAPGNPFARRVEGA